MNPASASCPVDHEFDPLSAEFLADPYASMENRPPVFYASSIDYYVVSRYADVEQVFLDPKSFSAAPAQLPLVELVPEAARILAEGGHRPQPSMVSLDPPAHSRLRGPTARAFTPRRVAVMEPRIREIVGELLQATDPTRPFDIVAALTQPLPLTVIFRLMGVPQEDWAQLRRWGANRLSLAWGRPSPEEQVEHAQNMAAYRGYLRQLVTAKATNRADDFASALLEIHDEDPKALTHEEVASILFSLSFAGHETTNNLLGNCIRRLLEEPARWHELAANPGLITGAVDEVLRYDPSVVVWRRQATEDVVIGEVKIPAGAKLFLWLAATGRDASTFPEPERFDMHRPNARRTLAFGRGIHFCIGAALGRLEAHVALQELTTRYPALTLAPGQEIPFHPNISFRGPVHLWVRAS
ncbi:MAG: cytochrome P450 [Solirubrobacteraceae bacterium]